MFEEPISFFKSVSGKLSVVVVGTILLATLILTSILYAYLRATIQFEVQVELQLQGESLREILTNFIDHQEQRIALVMAHDEFTELMTAVETSPERVAEHVAATDALVSKLVATNDDFNAIRITGRDSKVIVASDAESVGQTEYSEAVVGALMTGMFVQIEPTSTGHRAAMSRAIVDDAGNTLGAVVIDLDASALHDSIEALTVPHETSSIRLATTSRDGETKYLYVSDQDISELEQLGAFDEGMQQALAGETGFLSSTRDERGEEVLEAYMPVGYRNWGLVTKVDADDAYAGVRNSFLTLVSAGTIFAVLTAVLIVFIVQGALTPIRRLVRAAKQVQSGSYEVRVDVDRVDEVGRLARAFNSMVSQIIGERQELEKKVVERTHALRSSRDQLFRLVSRLEGQADMMNADLRRTEMLHRCLLPQNVPEIDSFSLAGTYIASHNVGGDLYNVQRIDIENIVLMIADAAGHGAAAALLSVLFKLRVDSQEEEFSYLEPADLLANVNNSLVAGVPAPGVFVSTVVCVLNTRTRQLTVVNAGHPPVLLMRRNRERILIDRSGPALGLVRDSKYEVHRQSLIDGDTLLLYTDGLFNVSAENQLTLDEIFEILHQQESNVEIIQTLLKRSYGNALRPDRDDLTLLLLHAQDESNYFPLIEDLDGQQSNVVAEAIEHTPFIGYVEEPARTVIYFSNRITWKFAQPFFDACMSMIKSDRVLVLDCKHCDYMDSAMLGTLYEFVAKANDARAPFSIQHVSEKLFGSFEELGLDIVKSAVCEESVEVPNILDATPLDVHDNYDSELRILKAHDELRKINRRNQEQFQGVVDGIREEMTSTI